MSVRKKSNAIQNVGQLTAVSYTVDRCLLKFDRRAGDSEFVPIPTHYPGPDLAPGLTRS